jgi:hypothetical protein
MWPSDRTLASLSPCTLLFGSREEFPDPWRAVYACECGAKYTNNAEVCPECGRDGYPMKRRVGRPWRKCWLFGYYISRWELK